MEQNRWRRTFAKKSRPQCSQVPGYRAMALPAAIAQAGEQKNAVAIRSNGTGAPHRGQGGRPALASRLAAATKAS